MTGLTASSSSSSVRRCIGVYSLTASIGWRTRAVTRTRRGSRHLLRRADARSRQMIPDSLLKDYLPVSIFNTDAGGRLRATRGPGASTPSGRRSTAPPSVVEAPLRRPRRPRRPARPGRATPRCRSRYWTSTGAGGRSPVPSAVVPRADPDRQGRPARRATTRRSPRVASRWPRPGASTGCPAERVEGGQWPVDADSGDSRPEALSRRRPWKRPGPPGGVDGSRVPTWGGGRRGGGCDGDASRNGDGRPTWPPRRTGGARSLAAGRTVYEA